MQPTFSYIYSLPYIWLFLIYFVLFLWENKLRKKDSSLGVIRFFCVTIFVFFFGFRGYLDTDFTVYYPLYEMTPTITDIHGISKFFSSINEDYLLKIEPGYKVFLILLKSINEHYFFLQFVSSLIDALFLNYFFKKYSPQYTLAFIMFFIFSGLIIEINLMRNSKAIFLFMYSLQYIKDRNIVKYFICNGLGLLFHSSAIFFFPLYFFIHKKMPTPIMWGIFLLGNLLYLGQVKFITPIVSAVGSLIGGSYALLAEGYSKDKMYSSGYGITIGYIERTLTFILMYVFYKKISIYINNQKLYNIFFNIFFIYIVANLYLSEYSLFIDRMTTLFVFSLWVLYPFLYVNIKEQYKGFFTVFLLLFGILKMYKSNNIIIRTYENILWDNPTPTKAYSRLAKHLDEILNPKKN